MLHEIVLNSNYHAHQWIMANATAHRASATRTVAKAVE